MAQTGFTPISLYYTATAAATPTAGNLVAGELAINTNDGKLFYKDSAGVVQTIASKDTNSGTFTNISVSGVASFADGTVSLPSITNIGDTNTGIFFPAADTIAFTEGGVESMRIDSSGNVGIGTSSPYSQLDVSTSIVSPTTGEATGVGSIRITNGAAALSSAGGLEFKNAGDSSGYGAKIQSLNSSGPQLVFANRVGSATWTERMRIDSSGNVGIGTSSPGFKLDVNGAIKVVGDGSSVAMYASADQALRQIGTSGGTWYFDVATGGATNGSFVWRSSNAYTERMRIDSSGNLLVGTTSVISGATFFSDSANGTCSSRCTTTTAGHSWTFGHDGNDNFRVLNNSATGVYLTYGGTTWTSLSDERTKTKLIPFKDALEKILSLRAGTGRYLKDEEGVSRSFLIAQDVQKVLPEAVNIQPDKMGSLGLSYTDVIPLLVASIKELKAELDSVKAELQTLKGN